VVPPGKLCIFLCIESGLGFVWPTPSKNNNIASKSMYKNMCDFSLDATLNLVL